MTVDKVLARLEAEMKTCTLCRGTGTVTRIDAQQDAYFAPCQCLIKWVVCRCVGGQVCELNGTAMRAARAAGTVCKPPTLDLRSSYCIRNANWARDVCQVLVYAASCAIAQYGRASSVLNPIKYITDLDIKKSSLRGKEDLNQTTPLPSIDSLMAGDGLLVVRLGFCAVGIASIGDHIADALATRGDRPMWVIDSPHKKTTPTLEERLEQMKIIDFAALRPNAGR